MKFITVGDLRELERQVMNEEISYSRMVEIINEMATEKVVNDSFLNEINGKQKLVDYIYEFAWLYGMHYRAGDANKILEIVKEKIDLPEQFINKLK